MTTAPYRHRTPSERRAQQSAQQAIARAWAHTRQHPTQPATEPTTAWDGGPTSDTPAEVACRQCYRPTWGYPGDLCTYCKTTEETTQP